MNSSKKEYPSCINDYLSVQRKLDHLVLELIIEGGMDAKAFVQIVEEWTKEFKKEIQGLARCL